MFWTRLLSGIVLVALAIGALYLGGFVTIAVLILLSLVGMREYYKVKHITGKPFSVIEVICYAGVVLYYLILYFGQGKLILPVLAVIFLAVMVAYVVTYPAYKNGMIACYIFGFFYVAVLFSFIFMIRSRETGIIDVWLVFLASWGSDTCAYCVGRLFGKHKMTPVLSPKKSIEGAIGGIVGSALLGLIFALIFKQSVLVYMVVCACGAFISIFGDLFASGIKRQSDIKDYGKLIPGHGGVLDRFDSVLFVAPVVYLVCTLMMG